MTQATVPERMKQLLVQASKSRTSIGAENRRFIVLPTIIAVPLLLALLFGVIGLIIRLLIGLVRVLRR